MSARNFKKMNNTGEELEDQKMGHYSNQVRNS